MTSAGAPTNPSGAPPTRAPQGGGSGSASSTARTPPGRIASTSLVAKGSKLPLRISCPAGSADCAGTLQLRTRAKVRLGKRTARRVTIARAVRYTVSKGKSKTVTVKLGLDGRALLRQRRSYKVTVTLKPAGGAAVNRTLTLRRG